MFFIVRACIFNLLCRFLFSFRMTEPWCAMQSTSTYPWSNKQKNKHSTAINRANCFAFKKGFMWMVNVFNLMSLFNRLSFITVFCKLFFYYLTLVLRANKGKVETERESETWYLCCSAPLRTVSFRFLLLRPRLCLGNFISNVYHSHYPSPFIYDNDDVIIIFTVMSSARWKSWRWRKRKKRESFGRRFAVISFSGKPEWIANLFCLIHN